jgi:hypothetical protein
MYSKSGQALIAACYEKDGENDNEKMQSITKGQKSTF